MNDDITATAQTPPVQTETEGGAKAVSSVSMTIDNYDNENAYATLRISGSGQRPNWLATLSDVFQQIVGTTGAITVKGTGEKAASIKSLFNDNPDAASGFKMIGDNQWVGFYSNAAQDQSGEYFPMKATDEFIGRVDKGVVPMPELWYWHTPGTKHGQADWIGRVGLTTVAVGHFDNTPLADDFKAHYRKNPKQMSHGFNYLKARKQRGQYGYYDTFEISPLPPGEADNAYTIFDVLGNETKDGNMSISEKKLKDLAGILNEENLAAVVNGAAAHSKSLRELGVSYKDAGGSDDPDPEPDDDPDDKKKKENATMPTTDQKLDALIMGVKALVDAQTAANEKAKAGDDPILKAINALTASQKELTDFIKDQYAESPRAAKSAATVIADSDPMLAFYKAMQAAQNPQAQKEALGNMGAIGAILGQLGSTPADINGIFNVPNASGNGGN